ncbi:MAG: hypothetical protein MJZ37_07425 [Bacilli bacterium]|nr:hypothetical protein [Bacilli bacterium]
MNLDAIEELLKIKALGELMINQDPDGPAEFSAGVINSLGRQITESIDNVLDKLK